MRLTLRTMLAYLDDILEPEDAEDIQKKISESDFATSLMHRTRDCVRRVRLGTPPLEGKGLAADSNTVSEYLDNTLEAERVPEFEKICLESDMHLAEVASCHQILTLVLGEPADVEGIRRERLYGLIARADKAPETRAEDSKPQPSHRTPSPADTQPLGSTRQRPTVPDYLRESTRSRRLPLVSTIAIVAVVTLVILLIAGPSELRHQVARWMGREVPRDEAAGPPAEPSPREPDRDVTPEARQPVEPEAEPGVEPEATPQPADRPQPVDVPPSRDEGPIDGEAPEQPDRREPTDDRLALPRPEAVPSDLEPRIAPAPPTPEQEPPLPDTDEAVAPAPADTEARGTPTAPTPDEPTLAPVAPPGPRDAAAPKDPSAPKDPAAPLDIAAAVGAQIGRYLTDQQVAVVYDRTNGVWQRLAPKAVIAAGDRVITLPAFRPSIALTNGVTIQAAGPSSLSFGVNEDGDPVVHVEYGRLLMFTVGKAGNQIGIRYGNEEAVVTFGDAQSSLALEVGSVFPAGVNPETIPLEVAVDLYATSGQIHWKVAGKTDVLKAPEHISLTGHSAANLPPGQLPEWAVREVLSPLDERAAPVLERELTQDRSLSLTIKELSEDRRREVRALAIRSGSYLGVFEPFVAALTDPEQKVSWQAHVESLRDALARSPETATQIREALEKHRGEAGRRVYRLLCGFNVEQLQSGDDKLLVDALDNESLDVRRLSFWNLQHITGKMFQYQPEFTPAKRKTPIARWREFLNEGKIRPQGAAGEEATTPEAKEI